ncbi:MAG TPA: hypothetical protein VK892_11965 [Pyrinomonadaceae bacterium]|nr:hypothetical protein [Pyrinomonadaceae bacterium]
MGLKGSTPKHKNLIYDVGMHKGQDTEFYLKKGFKVIGFEANPFNVADCKAKFSKEIESGQLVIVEGAITEVAEGDQTKVKFFRNEDTSYWGSTCEEFAYRNEVCGTTNEIIEVEAVDFAESLEKYGIPYYLKADIVGSEKTCLRALLGFENKPDYISIRSEKVIFEKLEEEFFLFEQLGYDKFKAVLQEFSKIRRAYSSLKNGNIEHHFEDGSSGPFGEETLGRWKTREEILKDYQRIFTLYWLFGDYSYLVQTEKGRKFIAQLERVVRRPIPGWYDTHAKHSSVKN